MKHFDKYQHLGALDKFPSLYQLPKLEVFWMNPGGLNCWDLSWGYASNLCHHHMHQCSLKQQKAFIDLFFLLFPHEFKGFMLLSTSCQILVVAGSGDRFTKWTWARECPKCDIGPWDLLPAASLQSTDLCTGNIGIVSLLYHAHTM